MIAKVCNRDGQRHAGFSDIAAYIGHESKAVPVRTSRGIAASENAAREMEFVARFNERVLNPVYHYVLSWPGSDRVTNEQIFDAVERSLEKIGATPSTCGWRQSTAIPIFSTPPSW